jgi:ABC-type Zn uptake system ZnuABC Zn-binding protein ZnuA
MKMKSILLLVSAFAALAITASAAPLKVVTTIPDLAEFARRVGGDRVDVFGIASGREDPHNVPMRPSAITRLQQADLFIVIGLEMEHAYAPALLAESRNQKIQRGAPGFLDLSGGVRPLELPHSLDRSEGDVHPNGNPHYNVDPVYGQMMVSRIADKLGELDPAGAAQFKANAAAYNQQLGAKIAQWRAKLGKGTKFVSYHPDLVYFAARFGLQQVGTIQPKPGIEPGPRYIDELTQRMQAEGVKLIAKESFYSDRVPNELAKRTGARVISVPIMVNGTADAKDYVSFIDAVVSAFASTK